MEVVETMMKEKQKPGVLRVRAVYWFGTQLCDSVSRPPTTILNGSFGPVKVR